MSKTADSPIKVYPETKDKLRHAASLMDCTQAELVGRAVDEYVERHRKLFAQRMDEAQRALLGGKAAALAHSLGVSEADVERLGGAASGQVAGSRKPRRATSNQAS
jgi:predicted transcriptional regulator